MNQRERVFCIARAAHGRFLNPSPINLAGADLVALVATEEGFTHLRDERGESDHHSTDRDQLIDVCNKLFLINTVFALVSRPGWLS